LLGSGQSSKSRPSGLVRGQPVNAEERRMGRSEHRRARPAAARRDGQQKETDGYAVWRGALGASRDIKTPSSRAHGPTTNQNDRLRLTGRLAGPPTHFSAPPPARACPGGACSAAGGDEMTRGPISWAPPLGRVGPKKRPFVGRSWPPGRGRWVFCRRTARCREARHPRRQDATPSHGSST